MLISNSEKGCAEVIQDVNDYKPEAERQRNNKGCYTELSYSHKELNHQTIERFNKEQLVEKVDDWRNVENEITSKFYTSPKIFLEDQS